MKTKDYEKQAADFLRKTGATIEIKFSHNGKHFDNDEQTRDIYKVTISKCNRFYTFNFGQSIAKSGLMLQMSKKQIYIELPESHKHLMLKINEPALRYWIKNHIAFDILPSDKITYPEQPTNYDILSCLQKYDIGSFEDFCNEFGYDPDSRAAEKTYNAVREEWLNVCRIWNDSEIEELQEIQ